MGLGPRASGLGRSVLLVVMFGCGNPPPPSGPMLTPAPAGTLVKSCNGGEFYVSSGNPEGKCHATLDDHTQALRSMQCDDGGGNDATFTCSADGHIGCSSHGTGLCSADKSLVRPNVMRPASQRYVAYLCGQKTFFVAPGSKTGSCVATFDKGTGTRAMHCDDGAGDSADFVCRDGEGVCTFTGSGICTNDEALVRK